jgi:predicted metalloprotease with PDZ domain
VSEDTLPHVIHAQLADYGRQAGRAPMQAVSNDKAKYYDLIYSGGFLVALALDVELRARTDLARGLPDMLRAMYAKFGGEGDPRYTAQDIAHVASETCGCDLLPFFTRYVFGMDVLPVHQFADQLGMVLPGDNAPLPARAERGDSPTPRLRSAWLSGWRSPPP